MLNLPKSVAFVLAAECLRLAVDLGGILSINAPVEEWAGLVIGARLLSDVFFIWLLLAPKRWAWMIYVVGSALGMLFRLNYLMHTVTGVIPQHPWQWGLIISLGHSVLAAISIWLMCRPSARERFSFEATHPA